MIKQNHQLSLEEARALQVLCAQCQKEEKDVPTVYLHRLIEPRFLPCNILYYEQEQLLGFLTTFFFYEEACEVAVLVSPFHRHLGIATKMLAQILPLLESQRVKTLIFSVPRHDINHRQLKLSGYVYERGEYHMQWQQRDVSQPKQKRLSIRQALTSDLEVMCEMDKACFFTTGPSLERLTEILASPKFTLLVAEKNKVVIAKAHILWQEDEARFSDVAVLPEYQRQGYGYELMSYVMQYCLENHYKTLTLDVESDNLSAIKLYERLGFVVSNACEFWSIPMTLHPWEK